jgi:hypothetical protein
VAKTRLREKWPYRDGSARFRALRLASDARGDAGLSCTNLYVRVWSLAAERLTRANINFWIRPGYSKTGTCRKEFDRNVWSGRAVQEIFIDWQMRSCINVSGLCLERIVLPTIMDISAVLAARWTATW